MLSTRTCRTILYPTQMSSAATVLTSQPGSKALHSLACWMDSEQSIENESEKVDTISKKNEKTECKHYMLWSPCLFAYFQTTVNVLNNDKLQVDFKPLFECIHIYTSLDSLNELQRSYQADRKACRGCILPPFIHSQAGC